MNPERRDKQPRPAEKTPKRKEGFLRSTQAAFDRLRRGEMVEGKAGRLARNFMYVMMLAVEGQPNQAELGGPKPFELLQQREIPQFKAQLVELLQQGADINISGVGVDLGNDIDNDGQSDSSVDMVVFDGLQFHGIDAHYDDTYSKLQADIAIMREVTATETDKDKKFTGQIDIPAFTISEVFSTSEAQFQLTGWMQEKDLGNFTLPAAELLRWAEKWDAIEEIYTNGLGNEATEDEINRAFEVASIAVEQAKQADKEYQAFLQEAFSPIVEVIRANRHLEENAFLAIAKEHVEDTDTLDRPWEYTPDGSGTKELRRMIGKGSFTMKMSRAGIPLESLFGEEELDSYDQNLHEYGDGTIRLHGTLESFELNGKLDQVPVNLNGLEASTYGSDLQYRDKYGNDIQVRYSKEVDWVTVVVNAATPFTYVAGAEYAPVQVDLQPVGLGEYKGIFEQPALRPKAEVTSDSFDISKKYGAEKSSSYFFYADRWSDDADKYAESVADAIYTVERLFGQKHGEQITHVHIPNMNEENGMALTFDPSTLIITDELFFGNDKMGEKYSMRALRQDTAMHEAVHLIEGKLGVRNDERIKTLFRDLPADFHQHLAESRWFAEEASFKAWGGHPWDNEAEFLASFFMTINTSEPAFEQNIRKHGEEFAGHYLRILDVVEEVLLDKMDPQVLRANGRVKVDYGYGPSEIELRKHDFFQQAFQSAREAIYEIHPATRPTDKEFKAKMDAFTVASLTAKEAYPVLDQE